MATLEERYRWVREILAEEPTCFSDYFKSDFSMFLENNGVDENSVEIDTFKEVFGRKFEEFNSCETKEGISRFIDDLTSHISDCIRHVEDDIYEYFN